MGFNKRRQSISEADRNAIRSDRRFVELALDEAYRLLGVRPADLSLEARRCPFHGDDHPSGSVFTDYRSGTWLYKCHTECGWNTLDPAKPGSTGDAIAVLRVAHAETGQPISFPEACEWLLNEFERRFSAAGSKSTGLTDNNAITPSVEDIAAAKRQAIEAHEYLLSYQGLLDHLHDQRAITKEVVDRFRVGYLEQSGRKWWVFPIYNDAGQFMAQKRHCVDGLAPKSQWYPRGAKLGNPVWPVSLEGEGPVWLCPGELKALAVISLALPAIGITSGEKQVELSPGVISILRGRSVAIAADNDDTGRTWAREMQQHLSALGIEARVVEFHA